MTSTLIHCLILTLTTGKVFSSCRVRDFKVQENFDIKKVISIPGGRGERLRGGVLSIFLAT